MSETKAPETVVSQQPAGQAQPTLSKLQAQTGTEEWHDDIFNCFEGPDNLCLKATFCSCFVYGKLAHRMRDPTLTDYNRFNVDCLIFPFCGIGYVLQFLKRLEARETYNIKGDLVTDVLFSACCACCSLIQVEKEVIARQSGSSSAGYVAPSSMVAAPQ
ncbi:uncharacterized protein K444DRAFT_543603 [Hyaloscypha bicolor E]|uniref:PLAC8-domain-containing protein n=1 Tax=Hyaloscypha bicolor E TaxID=1095630 RepID=A0A2J6SNU0_9HELO|nr:uncharacterized protein K444DRAFT_543603 [Hyaloscypha bicolor E]PMD52441.1 hypothetical protein K444DRAFT_543603 [Hyaloscypha bicolor E]